MKKPLKDSLEITTFKVI